jgi:integrase
LPKVLISELLQQMEFARAVWRRDRQNGIPVMLPGLLDKKYPEYKFAWPWAWFFPAHQPCKHPCTGAFVRYRMHEANVQRAVKNARRKLGISVLPHELRHGCATHCLERNSNPRAIQAAMGHKSLETTMGYLHVESMSVDSPLDMLPRVTNPGRAADLSAFVTGTVLTSLRGSFAKAAAESDFVGVSGVLAARRL